MTASERDTLATAMSHVALPCPPVDEKGNLIKINIRCRLCYQPQKTIYNL